MNYFLVVLCFGAALAQGPKECQETADCKAFSFCAHHSHSTNCETNMKQPDANAKNCSIAVAGKTVIPQHKICADEEAEEKSFDAKFSTSRCYPQLGYTCAISYYMPCTANHASDGTVLAGQEESCPENFKCTEEVYKTETVKLCKPIPIANPSVTECKDNFDCGYSVIERKWSSCNSGRCLRALE